jgi:hypothetical protein
MQNKYALLSLCHKHLRSTTTGLQKPGIIPTFSVCFSDQTHCLPKRQWISCPCNTKVFSVRHELNSNTSLTQNSYLELLD